MILMFFHLPLNAIDDTNTEPNELWSHVYILLIPHYNHPIDDRPLSIVEDQFEQL